jgi:multidrug efflux pump subunit AcrB
VVRAVIRDELDGHRLPQVWEELEGKIDDMQPNLPPGAGPSVVDDFGDIYSVCYALAGEGFTPAELKQVAKLLRRELGTIDGVKETILFGEQQEIAVVEISNAEIKASGVGLDRIFDALRGKNLPADAGRIRVGSEYVPIYPSALYRSEQDFGDFLIAGDNDRLIRLDQIAKIRRDYEDPPRRLLRVDGNPAIGIALSAVPGGDLVAMGEAVKQRLEQLESRIPLGMELRVIALQPQAATEAIDAFLTRLALAFLTIIAALVFFMGLRGGLIVGFVTLLTMAGTLAVMDYFQIGLNHVSLGALVIALGLVPANAIVVVDGMKVRIGQGIAGRKAAREVVTGDAIHLLGATAVSVLAFAPIAGMYDSAGEYTRSLYLVLLIALPISWVTAFTTAPVLAERFLKSEALNTKKADPYGGRIYRGYCKTLAAAIRRRRTVLGATAALFALSLFGFAVVKQVYLPPYNTPAFLVEIDFREGTHIRETERRMDDIQAYLHSHAGITQVATAVGEGHPRHLPIYRAVPPGGSNRGVSLVFVDDHRRVDEIRFRIQADLEIRFPDAVVNVKKLARASENSGGRIQVRISGPDPVELRRLADRAKAVIASDPDAKAVRDEWGAKVKVAQPVLGKERARRLRIDRKRIAEALRTAYSGTVTGYYREGSELIPIVARAPREERSEVEDMADIQVTSPLRGDQIPMLHIVDRLETLTEDARRSRRDGRPTITVHADASRGPTLELLERIKPRVEKALGMHVVPGPEPVTVPSFEIDFDTILIVRNDTTPLKGRPGYFMSWGGEGESYAQSQARLAASIPLYLGLMVLVTIALFNALRQPLIVLLAVPLSMIGVTAGLLLAGQPFGFMSLLGVLGLCGVLMKNAILMVGRIDLEIGKGKARFAAILDAGSSSLRPVAIAAGITVVALLPLLRDDLFRSMTVTIAAGLAVATILSLVLVPVLYAALFGVGKEDTG